MGRRRLPGSGDLVPSTGTGGVSCGDEAGRRRLLGEGVAEEAAEKRKASVRAKVEHPFLYVKQHFGYAKVRYRGGQSEEAAHHGVAAGGSHLLIAGRYATGCQGSTRARRWRDGAAEGARIEEADIVPAHRHG